MEKLSKFAGVESTIWATLLILAPATWGCATRGAGAPEEPIDPCSEQADDLTFERMMTGYADWYVRGPGNRRVPINHWYTRNGRTEQQARAMVTQLEGARFSGQIQTLVGPRVFKIGNEVGMREMFMALDACDGPEPR